MLRIATRLPAINKQIAGICNKWYCTLGTHSRNSTLSLEQSKRYDVFSPSSMHIYQYDGESKRLTEWHAAPTSTTSDWQHLPADEIRAERYIDAFRTMLDYSRAQEMPLTDERFDRFIDRFIEQMPGFCTNELLRAIQMFARAGLTRELMVQRNYVELHRAFDRRSTIELACLQVNQCIFLCSIWLEIPFNRKTYFAMCASRVLNRRFGMMAASELGLAAFYLARLKRPVDEIRELENHFDRTINEMTIEDIAMMAWAFEQNDAKIENLKLRDKLFTRLVTLRPNEFSLSVLNKLCPFIMRIVQQSDAPLVRSMLEDARKSVLTRSLDECICLMRMGAPIELFDEVIMQHTFDLCLAESPEFIALPMAALADLARSLSRCHDQKYAQTKDLVGHRILAEVKNRLHCVTNASFYTTMLHIIQNLIQMDVYDLELMENLFRSEMLQLMHPNDKAHNLCLYEIDGYNRINLRHVYRGQHLPQIFLANVKFLTDFIPDRIERYHKRHRFFYAMEDVIGGLFPQYSYAHALPFYKFPGMLGLIGHLLPNIIVCFNIKTMTSIDIPEGRLENDSHPIEASCITGGDPDVIALAFVAGTTSPYIERGELVCNHHTQMYLKQKQKQLELLGFHTIPVVVPGWNENLPNKHLEDVIVSRVDETLAKLGATTSIRHAQSERNPITGGQLDITSSS